MANLWISFPRNLGYKTEHIHADFLECRGFVLSSKKKPNLDILYLSLFIHLAPSEVYTLLLISLRLTIFDFIILLNCLIFFLTLIFYIQLKWPSILYLNFASSWPLSSFSSWGETAVGLSSDHLMSLSLFPCLNASNFLFSCTHPSNPVLLQLTTHQNCTNWKVTLCWGWLDLTYHPVWVAMLSYLLDAQVQIPFFLLLFSVTFNTVFKVEWWILREQMLDRNMNVS